MESSTLNDLARHIPRREFRSSDSSRYALCFKYHIFDISKRSYLLFCLFLMELKFHAHPPAPESSSLSYFWLIFLIQPEFPHSLSPGLSADPYPVPSFSCPTSSPEAFKPLLPKSMQHVPFPSRRVKPKLNPSPFISALTWHPISLIRLACAVVQAQNQKQR